MTIGSSRGVLRCQILHSVVQLNIGRIFKRNSSLAHFAAALRNLQLETKAEWQEVLPGEFMENVFFVVRKGLKKLMELINRKDDQKRL